jgi:hypothetical protein
MKEQTMDVAIGNTLLKASTNGFVHLKELTVAGNSYRALKGRDAMNVAQYIKTASVNEFVEALVRKYGGVTEDFIKTTGRGRGAKTMVCLQLAVKVAMKMDSDFEVTVIDQFINNEILKKRLLGGDQFKILNRHIDRYLPGREGKSNVGIYINVAKMIKAKCAIPTPRNANLQTWNQKEADGIAQNLRYNYEVKLTHFLEMGFIKDWEHLKETINKL